MTITSIPASTPEPEERRRQDSISLSVMDTFQRINFSQVFHCNSQVCGRAWLGKDLQKTRDGQHVCPHCHGYVTDVTNSPLGRSFLAIVMPGLKAQ